MKNKKQQRKALLIESLLRKARQQGRLTTSGNSKAAEKIALLWWHECRVAKGLFLHIHSGKVYAKIKADLEWMTYRLPVTTMTAIEAAIKGVPGKYYVTGITVWHPRVPVSVAENIADSLRALIMEACPK